MIGSSKPWNMFMNFNQIMQTVHILSILSTWRKKSVRAYRCAPAALHGVVTVGPTGLCTGTTVELQSNIHNADCQVKFRTHLALAVLRLQLCSRQKQSRRLFSSSVAVLAANFLIRRLSKYGTAPLPQHATVVVANN